MSKIEWCDLVWNPVWGCENNCEYCYARKMAKRFGEKMTIKELKIYGNSSNWPIPFYQLKSDLKNFKPTWLQSNFDKPLPKKPKRIFVNSMSDIYFWETEWMKKVIDKIKGYPQHTFLFLTKIPYVYEQYAFSDNCYLGVTITNQQDMNAFAELIWETKFDDKHKLFLSIEPIQEKIKLYVKPDWIIIGAETGNRKNKIIPEPEWIEPFTNLDIPVFIKNNVWPYYKCDKQEFPK